MTTQHVAALHFEGRVAAAKKRLQRLKAGAFITERPRKPFDQAVLCLARRGLAELRERGILTEYPAFDLPALERRGRVSDLTLRHELEVMDVKAALSTAIRQTWGGSLAEFTTWPVLVEFESKHGVVKPDGFMRISEIQATGSITEHAFFLEIDRSTEPQATLARRAASYVDYYKSGGFAVRQGGSRSDYKKHPFRVLYILKTEERRNNTAEALLQSDPPILSHVWLTTMREITEDPLGAIWLRPIEYREALAGTLFDAPRPVNRPGYARQTTRDALVALHARKQRLLTETARD